MNFITLSLGILVAISTTFIATNKSLNLQKNKQLTKCPKIIIKNLKNEVLIDSIHFPDSLIFIELIGEANMKYDIREIEINVAQDRKMLGKESYFNVKNGDTLNIARCIQKLIKRKKELQDEPKEHVNEDIAVIERSLRMVIDLKTVIATDKVSEQKSSISEWCRGRITILYSE